MGKIIKNSSGKVFVASGDALEVTASIDSNITAGNIKKDVTILGVVGTYEGSGGGSVVVQANIDLMSVCYYVKSDGTVAEIDPGMNPGGTITLNCLASSLMYIESPMDNASTITGATLIFNTSHGMRGTEYVWLYQVNAQ